MMPVNSISPGSYNSPSIQPEVTDLRPTDKKKEVGKESMPEEVLPERIKPIINTSGQVVGSVINTKA